MLCPGNTFTKSLNFGEDGVWGSGPGERSGVSVVVMNEAFDVGHQFPNAAEGSPADRFLGDDVEPDFYLVEPGGIGGGEVQVVTGACGQPASDAGVLVSGIVVHDQVHLESRRDTGVHVPEKFDELLVTMAAFALTPHRSGEGVESREQGGGAVPEIVVGHPFHVAE